MLVHILYYSYNKVLQIIFLYCFFFDYPHAFIKNSIDSLFSEEFDLIIVYYVSNFLSVKQIKEISQHYKAKVAFYLMDMGPMTGGCHYAWNCTGYLEGCYACPITSKSFCCFLL